ncbi:hypothetical protein ACG2OD_13570 [Streptomyces sp. PDY-4]|nr:hypothetical protein [Streptomyces fungicidicus]
MFSVHVKASVPVPAAWLRWLAVRWERPIELHDAFVSLACSLICWRRLKKANS